MAARGKDESGVWVVRWDCVANDDEPYFRGHGLGWSYHQRDAWRGSLSGARERVAFILDGRLLAAIKGHLRPVRLKPRGGGVDLEALALRMAKRHGMARGLADNTHSNVEACVATCEAETWAEAIKMVREAASGAAKEKGR